MLAALAAAHDGLAPEDDWRFARLLPADRDPAVAGAVAAGRRFADRHPVVRIADA